jgi:DNA-binding NarL/FixJ family response regulator
MSRANEILFEMISQYQLISYHLRCSERFIFVLALLLSIEEMLSSALVPSLHRHDEFVPCELVDKNCRYRNVPYIFQKRSMSDSFKHLGRNGRSVSCLKNHINSNIDRTEKAALYQFRSERWILLVDDEAAICDAVGRLLIQSGYQVTTCQNGNEALQIALNRQVRGGTMIINDRSSVSTSSSSSSSSTITTTKQTMKLPRTLPDAIVSDVRMPIMDGLTLLQHIRSNPQLVQIPVILLTAKSMSQDRIAGYNAGADAYIPKPFDPDELISIIDNAIRRHESLNDSNNVALTDLQRDVQDIKSMLLEKGNRVLNTSVFLAPDERQVLYLLCQGKMNKEIASEMYMSTRRVEQLLTILYRKVEVKNRTELVRWAISTGNVKL